MKKLLIASSLLVSSSAMATGFYAGAQAGLAADSAKIETQAVSDVDPAEVKNLGKNSAAGGLYAGYTFDLDAVSLSLEVDYILGSSKSELSFDGGANVADLEIKRKDTYSAGILAGFPVSNDLSLYGRLGYTHSKFTLNQKFGAFQQYDKSKSSNGITVGLGAKYQLDNALALRIDYRYTQFKEIEIAAASTATTVTKDAKVKPHQQLFMVGLQYSF